jgi:hypothetical protein
MKNVNPNYFYNKLRKLNRDSLVQIILQNAHRNPFLTETEINDFRDQNVVKYILKIEMIDFIQDNKLVDLGDFDHSVNKDFPLT